MASSLIYEAKLRIKRDLGFILVSTPIIIDALGWWELFVVSTPASGIPALLLILDIAWLFPAFFLSGFLAKWFPRNLRLRVDALAAELVWEIRSGESAGEDDGSRSGRLVCRSNLGEGLSILIGAYER